MNKPKGGRGITAPYATKQMRVPVGLENQIQELISRYRDWLSESSHETLEVSNPPNLLGKPVDSLSLEIEKLCKLVDSLYEERDLLNSKIASLSDSKPVDKIDNSLSTSLEIPPMGLRQLAKRLEVPHSTISYHLNKGDLAKWSKQLDPDHLSWSRSHAESKQFFPYKTDD